MKTIKIAEISVKESKNEKSSKNSVEKEGNNGRN